MFKLEEIAKITGARMVNADKDLTVSGVSTDSRKISSGDIFIALKGPNFAGDNFLNDARKNGALAALISDEKKALPGFPALVVYDTKKALGEIARAHRMKFDIPVIAVTGSNGKTTTKEMIAHILQQKSRVLKTLENENNQIGVPLTLLRLKEHDAAVVEVGTNSFGEIAYNADIIRPNIAVITNIGPSHLEGLIDKKGVLKEKAALVESLKRGWVWVKNSDDEMLAGLDPKNINTVTYGIKNKHADLRAENIRQHDGRTSFDLKVRGKSGSYNISIPLLGAHNIYNALSAVACCLLFVDIKTIQKALLDFKSGEMRTEVKELNGITVIDDSYNSNPLSLEYASSVLKDYPADGKKIMAAGDMLELGKMSKELHYESGKKIAISGSCDMLLTFGRHAREMAKGAADSGMGKENISSFSDKGELAKYLKAVLMPGDVILVKGSRGMKMEEVVNYLLEEEKQKLLAINSKHEIRNPKQIRNTKF